jgi:hypothetical protein
VTGLSQPLSATNTSAAIHSSQPGARPVEAAPTLRDETTHVRDAAEDRPAGTSNADPQRPARLPNTPPPRIEVPVHNPDAVDVLSDGDHQPEAQPHRHNPDDGNPAAGDETGDDTVPAQTAAAVAYWRRKRPDLHPADIAALINKSERTVRRHLTTPTEHNRAQPRSGIQLTQTGHTR